MSREQHLFVHGFRAIEELLEESSRGSILMLSRAGPRHRRLAELAASSGVPVRKVSEGELSSHAELSRHRGALLRIRNRQQLTDDRQLAEMIARAEPYSLVVAVDGVTDTANLGAILRSAESFGVNLVVLQANRAASITPSAVRASAGATAYLKIVTVTNLARALTRFQKHGFWVVGADLDGEPLDEYGFAERSVIVFGAEGSGIRPGIRGHCDSLVTVETSGRIGSLNVSVAAGIVLYRASCSRAKDFCHGR